MNQEQTSTVLVVDDESAIRRVLETGLRARGYDVQLAPTGQEGVDKAATVGPDVMILDLGLPDIDGVEVCRRVREWSDVPIIVLSVEGSETRKVEALDEGADDFVTKPFGMAELLARVRVALRHRELAQEGDDRPEIEAGPIRIDVAAHEVMLHGEQISLTDTEFRILVELVSNVGKVLTHRMLLEAVWGPGYRDELHYLRVYVNRLRKKLETDPSSPRLLVTVPRVGYRLDAEDLSERER